MTIQDQLEKVYVFCDEEGIEDTDARLVAAYTLSILNLPGVKTVADAYEKACALNRFDAKSRMAAAHEFQRVYSDLPGRHWDDMNKEALDVLAWRMRRAKTRGARGT